MIKNDNVYQQKILLKKWSLFLIQSKIRLFCSFRCKRFLDTKNFVFIIVHSFIHSFSIIIIIDCLCFAFLLFLVHFNKNMRC
jgi:hypothetical protein